MVIQDCPSLEAAIGALFPQERPLSIMRREGIGGGCINTTSLLVLSNGVELFLKENTQAFSDAFKQESCGLESLISREGPVIPRPLAKGEEGGNRAFLLLEYLPPTRKPRGGPFWERFGRALALLHKEKSHAWYGFSQHNYLGETLQRNEWMEEWIPFFREKRLRFQIEMASDKGRIDTRLRTKLDKLKERLPTLLIEESPVLLHGDLWSGNCLALKGGEAAIFDPAVYYGCREADLAMTELFGGFPSSFYEAYEEVWPLTPGYTQRAPLYNLYHLLNHLNLFGSSYLGQVKAVVEHYL